MKYKYPHLDEFIYSNKTTTDTAEPPCANAGSTEAHTHKRMDTHTVTTHTWEIGNRVATTGLIKIIDRLVISFKFNRKTHLTALMIRQRKSWLGLDSLIPRVDWTVGTK